MNYVENLLIYARNLSPFYIFTMAISFLVVLLTAYFGFSGCSTTTGDDGPGEQLKTKSSSSNKQMSARGTVSNNNINPKMKDDSSAESVSENDDEDECENRLHIESLGQLKTAKLKSIENSLTEEQRQAEKEIEQAQLAAIFELLKKQNNSSNINEEELKEQLSLYR
ncbi:uncharacterized protein LOC128721719 [Anopheles nili]|uniref:uncharacterized protein LOC128721719 n=1 Tax=Anopheles nili TaxID=185578 RepID=UPI00237B8C45|nr:uncharacterized protein LOC128721719 [Anopheles nili]